MKILLCKKSKKYLMSNNYHQLCMTRGKDRRISIFSKDEWNRQEGRLKSIFENIQKETKMSDLFSSSIEVDLKKNHYAEIELPDELKKWAGISSDFVVIARRNRVEIWSKNNYNSFCESNDSIILQRTPQE